ncbi:hypothetical protein K7472_30855 [Streptomyces sp. PTM05]|uniref:Uncharacterized protein n=1 Tax=Streptantibioticus parmotrematis TaxID=2873249 RepID=A0ABS7R5A5_9ACTN|nr:DUF6415 family natural product biosynthesis protein [Streptantibioticus parmotrematis]MBY8889214.1 hypothetical protein [Streptantibioticus parmotrematis]
MRYRVLGRNVDSPRLSQEGLCRTDPLVKARTLAALRGHFLLESPEVPVVDAVFDDLELVLGEDAELTGADVARLTPRLHLVYRRILLAASQPSSGVRPETAAASRNLLVERFPNEFVPARAHLRRLAMAVSDLLDELLEDMP